MTLLIVNAAVVIGYGLIASSLPVVVAISSVSGLLLSLALAGALVREWRSGDRVLAMSEAARRRVDRLAREDMLTGLANRRVFEQELAQLCRRARTHGAPFALHLVDVDGLKAINDRFGHQAGDRVLRAVGDRLRSSLRHDDLVARLAGDEFVVLQSRATSESAARLAVRMLEHLRQPLGEAGETVVPTASVGTALCPADGTTATALMAAADRALYRAKAAGRDRWAAASERCAGELAVV